VASEQNKPSRRLAAVRAHAAELLRLARWHGAEQIYLVGSVATGTDHDGSDGERAVAWRRCLNRAAASDSSDQPSQRRAETLTR